MSDDREEIARLSQLRNALNTSAFVMDAVLEVYSDWEQWGVKLREDLDAILARAQGPGPGEAKPFAWAWRKVGDDLWQFDGNRECPPLAPPDGYEQIPLYAATPTREA